MHFFPRNTKYYDIPDKTYFICISFDNNTGLFENQKKTRNSLKIYDGVVMAGIFISPLSYYGWMVIFGSLVEHLFIQLVILNFFFVHHLATTVYFLLSGLLEKNSYFSLFFSYHTSKFIVDVNARNSCCCIRCF